MQHQIIRASAGTGKTHRLSTRYLQLTLAGEPLQRILATTFTRKAAGEIFDRVVQRLVQASKDDEGRRELAKQLDVDSIDRQACDDALLRLTRQMHRIRILTLDAFFAELAHSFALEVSLPPGWQIADDSMQDRIRDRTIQRLLARLGTEKAARMLNWLAQGEAKRVHNLVTENVKSLWDVYRGARPFGDAIWDWIDVGTEASASDVAAAMEYIQLSEEPWATASRAALNKFQDETWGKFLDAKIVARAANEDADKKPLAPGLARALNILMVTARYRLLVAHARQAKAVYQLLQEYERDYLALRDQMKIAFFSDIPDALRALDDAGGQLAYRLDGRIDHVLLDEFQDTSSDQWRVLAGLVDRIVADESESSLFCVGDVKQAIYAWRHGASEILESMDKRYGLEAVPMDTSRRSSTAVIQFVNRVCSQLGRSLGSHQELLDEWAQQFPPHRTLDSAVEGYVCVRSSEQAEDGERQSERDDAATARLVAEMWEEDPHHNLAVLVRKNETVGKLIRQLRTLGVNASEDGGNPLTNSAPVRVVLSLMHLIDHPHDLASRFHFAHSPLAKPYGVTPQNSDVMIAQVVKRLRQEIMAEGLGSVLASVANRLAAECHEVQRRRLRQLVDLAYVYERNQGVRTRGFVEFVHAKRVADPTAADVHVMVIHQAKGLEFDRVVMAELGGKYYQNPPMVYGRDATTFAPNRIGRYVGDGREYLPAEYQALISEDTRRRIREEMCLLYVAMTRAKFELQLVVPPKSAKNLISGLLLNVLQRESWRPGEIELEIGNPRWFDEAVPKEANAPSPPKRQEPTEAPIHFQQGQGTASIRKTMVAPSRLEAGGDVAAGAIYADDRQEAMATGTLMHHWLEHVLWWDEKLPDVRDLITSAQSAGLTASPGQCHAFLELFQSNALKSILVKERYLSELQAWSQRAGCIEHPIQKTEVFNEFAISWNTDENFLTGFVDRLVVIWANERMVAADIIDYKTDAVSDDVKLNERVEHYRPQLQAYRAAIGGMLRIPIERIRIRLAFTQADRVVDLGSPNTSGS